MLLHQGWDKEWAGGPAALGAAVYCRDGGCLPVRRLTGGVTAAVILASERLLGKGSSKVAHHEWRGTSLPWMTLSRHCSHPVDEALVFCVCALQL